MIINSYFVGQKYLKINDRENIQNTLKESSFYFLETMKVGKLIASYNEFSG